MQDRTELTSEHLCESINNKTQLDNRTSKNPKNMLKSCLRNCKSVAKLGLAISVSAIGILLTGQPEPAKAATNTDILKSYSSDSSHKIVDWDNKLTQKSRFLALRQNPLLALNINQNFYKNSLKNSLSELPIAQINEQVKIEKAKSLTTSLRINNPYEQNLSLVEQTNSIESVQDNSQLLLEESPKEYIFQIPSLKTAQNQPVKDTELNSKLTDFQNLIKRIHIVQPGETLNEIAKLYGITRQQLIEENSIQNPNLIFVYQRLKIPQTNGVERQQITERSNSLLSNNNSTDATVQNGNQVGNTLRENVTPKLSGIDNSAMEDNEEVLSSPTGITITLSANTTPELPPLSSPEKYLPVTPTETPFNGYIWPAKGTFTSGFGWRWGRRHNGVDIAAPIGTPIMAAAAGEVISAGWNSGGFGNLVKVKHPNGSVTLYAHNNRILVRRGQKVEQGQQIAQMGSTGYSTGSHLHFEIRLNGKAPVNPIAYLPRK